MEWITSLRQSVDYMESHMLENIEVSDVAKEVHISPFYLTKIYKEWLPGNPDYEIAFGADVEWYDNGDMNAPDYRSEIWIPVRAK